MRKAVLLTTILASATVYASLDLMSADLVGTWSCGTSSSLGNGRYTFRADHTFDGIDGGCDFGGPLEAACGQQAGLIYYSDYERKIISRSSLHHWIVIKPLTRARLEFVWFNRDFSPGFQYSSGGVWTKRR